MFDQLSVGLWRSPLDIGFFVMIKKNFFFGKVCCVGSVGEIQYFFCFS